MAGTERDDAAEDQPGSVAVVGEPEPGEQAAAEIALASAPEVLAGSLGEYTRVWLRRGRHRESRALPVIIGLVLIRGHVQSRRSSLLSAGEHAHPIGAAGRVTTHTTG